MKTYRFYGSSDDNFIWRCTDEAGKRDEDEIGCFDRHVVVHLKSAVSEERIAIFGEYSPEGTGSWLFAPALISEDDPLPAWPIRFEREHGYSMALIIEVPNDTTMTEVAPHSGEA